MCTDGTVRLGLILFQVTSRVDVTMSNPELQLQQTGGKIQRPSMQLTTWSYDHWHVEELEVVFTPHISDRISKPVPLGIG